MTGHDHKPRSTDWKGRERLRGSENDTLDREFDAALAKYASVEPRAGLEDRVLANLRAQHARVLPWGFWSWSSAAALAVALIVVAWALAWRPERLRPDNTARRPTPTTPGGQLNKQVVSNSTRDGVRPHKLIPVQRSTGRNARPPVMVAAQPKLERFPSPQPLSEQEKILASYVANYPEHAVLMARARTDALRRDQIDEMQAFPSRDRATDSEEQSNNTTER